LGVLVLAFVLWKYGDDIRRAIPRLSGVEVFGLKLSLMNLDAWSEGASNLRKIRVTSRELKWAIDRAKSAHVYPGTRILWADENPMNNLWERRAFTALGADVTVVMSNQEALDRACRADFDILISDLRRDDEDPRQVAKYLAELPDPPGIIYYTLDLTDRPSGSFGVTNRPDELVNLTTDLLEGRASKSELEPGRSPADDSAQPDLRRGELGWCPGRPGMSGGVIRQQR
jgi:hypothetical protein